MIQRLTAWFPVLLLAAVAAVTVWLDRHVQPPETANTGKARHDPDYIAENFTVTRIGPDGAVRYKMKARRMQHYPDDDTTDLEAPNVVNFRDAGITMTASSKTAKLSSNGDDVYLQDDVRLTRSAYDNHSELVMLTTWLPSALTRHLGEGSVSSVAKEGSCSGHLAHSAVRTGCGVG